MKKHVPFYKKKRFIIPAIIVGVVLLAFRLSPVPGAAIIRIVFDAEAQQKKVAMEKVIGNITTVSATSNVAYSQGDSNAVMDIYTPDKEVSDNSLLPVIIWIHGGAWLSGDKTDASPYFKKLAQEGFVVVAVNYSLAPNKKYPFQVQQINQAYKFVNQNIEKYNGDNSKIVLAGDSAGAQLSSQLAAITTNSSYAKEMGIAPSLKASQISGVVLYCGIYKMEGLAEPHADLSRIISWGNRMTIWSLTGIRDASSASIRQMSTYYHVDSNFPKTFISGGNADLLTKAQSVPFSLKLQSLNVDVQTLFYDDDHTPALNHENQFILDRDGIQNFKTVTSYIKSVTN